MKTKFYSLFVLVLAISLLVACAPKPVVSYEQSVLACGGPGNLAHYDKDGFDCKGAAATKEPAIQQVENNPSSQIEDENAPAAQAQGEATSYEVSGNTVMVYEAGKLIAKVEFKTKVDNMPTEWLKDRNGIAYLYQSGIGNSVELVVTLMEGGAFAVDGDWMSYGGANLGVVDNGADFRAFADAPGEYRFTASSFGLAVGVYNGTDDKAGFVLTDRRNADNDSRPEYYLPSGGGKPVELGK